MMLWRRPHLVTLLGWGALLACGSRQHELPSAPPPMASPRSVEAIASGEPADPEPTWTAETRAALAALAPSPLPPAPPDVTNKWADDPRAATFGRRLFFDADFSGKLLDGDNDGTDHALGRKGEVGKVSCSGCHLPKFGFSDGRSVNRQISLGAGWGTRRAPSLLDVGQSKLLMWDGRRDTLHNQILGPIESEVEMNSSRLLVAEKVFARHRAEYEAIFGAMPPLQDAARFAPLAATQAGCARLDAKSKCSLPQRGAPGDRQEFDRLKPADQEAVTRVVVNVGKAIAAYERLLACGSGRFDRFMHGDATALSRADQRGAALFVGKARCIACHSGPFFSDEQFHNVGLKPAYVATVFHDIGDEGALKGLTLAKADPLNAQGRFSDGDDGRLPTVLEARLQGAFRTPRLRCASQRPSLMHTGQLRTLEQVVSFFNRGGDRFGYPGENELRPLALTPRERSDLVAFMASLDGPGPSADLLGPP